MDSGWLAQVYLSTRRGAWIWNRVSHNGYPYDIWYMNRSFDRVRRFVSFPNPLTFANEV